MKIVVGISGASGIVLGVRVLQMLNDHETHLVISNSAKEILKRETSYELSDLYDISTYHYDNKELDAEIASGTSKFDAMVIAPCSTSTLAKIACGIGDNLITRAAAVALKERKPLIIVPRETPLSAPTLKRMYELSLYGAIIMPPIPAFYLNQKSIDEVIDYITGKILDHLGMAHKLYDEYHR